MHPNRTSRRIDRGGRNWTAPTHLSDWQRERAEPPFTEVRATRRELLATVAVCVVLWLLLIGIVLGISAALS